MSQEIRLGSILIKENLSLPRGVTVDSETYSPGWKLVSNLDGHGLARAIARAHWNFFYLAVEIKGIAFGRENPATLGKVLKRIAAKPEGQQYNSLEVTGVVAKRFLGIPFVRVVANFRHIQERIGLSPTRKFVLRAPVPLQMKK